MSTPRVILDLDAAKLGEGYVPVIKIGPKGRQRGVMMLNEVADLLNKVFSWDSSQRQVRLMSRFDESPFVAFGRDGAEWEAVAEIPPAEYYLVGAREQAYHVKLPRLVVRVKSHGWPWFFWTADHEPLTPQTKLYPLVLSNVYTSGNVCLGTTGLRCKTPDDIPKFVRQVIEARGDHMLGQETTPDKLYERLERDGWDPTIGQRYGITLAQLIKRQSQS